MVNFNLLPSRDIGGFPGVMMILFVAFGGLLFGYDTGTISGVSGRCVYFLPSSQHCRGHESFPIPPNIC